MTSTRTTPATKTFCVSSWETTYQKAYIEAASEQEARQIAEAWFTDDNPSGIEWSAFDGDHAVVDVEEI